MTVSIPHLAMYLRAGLDVYFNCMLACRHTRSLRGAVALATPAGLGLSEPADSPGTATCEDSPVDGPVGKLAAPAS